MLAEVTHLHPCDLSSQVLRHLVQRLGDQLNGRQDRLLLAVSHLLAVPSYRVRLALAQLIGALATRGYLAGEAGRPLLLFLMRQASPRVAISSPHHPTHAALQLIPLLCIAPPACVHQAALPPHEADPSHRQTVDTVGAVETKEVASKTLELLASTVPSMRDVLWLLLLHPLMSDECAGVLSIHPPWRPLPLPPHYPRQLPE